MVSGLALPQLINSKIKWGEVLHCHIGALVWLNVAMKDLSLVYYLDLAKWKVK